MLKIKIFNLGNLILKNEAFIERLRSLIGERSVKDFANDVEMPYGTINSMLNGSLPSIERAARIAILNDVSLDWLIVGEDNAKYISDLIQVPYYDVRASAGTGELVEAEELRGEISFKRDWLRQYVQNVDYVGIIEATGDSMTKPNGGGIGDGDLLLLDNSVQTFVRNGIYVIDINGYLLVKRLEMLVSGGLAVISDSPDYPDQEINAQSVDSLRILGKVFHHMRPIR